MSTETTKPVGGGGQTPPRPERKATLRLGQRQLHLITLAVILIVVLPLLFVGYRAFRNFKASRDIVIAKNNLRNLYTAMYGYAEDWDGKLPTAEKWTDGAAGYLHAPASTPGGSLSYLKGPGDGEDVGYVYNELAAEFPLIQTGKMDPRFKNIDPGRLVLLIERPGAERNAHVRIPPQVSTQAEEELYKQLSFPHYEDDPNNASTVILYANGHIVVVKRQDYKDLKSFQK